MSPSVTQFCPAFVLMLSLLERRAVCSCETKPTIHCNKGTQEVVYLTLTLITTSVSVWLLLVFRQHFLHKQVSSVWVTLTAFSLLLHNSYLRSLRSNSASHLSSFVPSIRMSTAPAIDIKPKPSKKRTASVPQHEDDNASAEEKKQKKRSKKEKERRRLSSAAAAAAAAGASNSEDDTSALIESMATAAGDQSQSAKENNDAKERNEEHEKNSDEESEEDENAANKDAMAVESTHPPSLANVSEEEKESINLASLVEQISEAVAHRLKEKDPARKSTIPASRSAASAVVDANDESAAASDAEDVTIMRRASFLLGSDHPASTSSKESSGDESDSSSESEERRSKRRKKAQSTREKQTTFANRLKIAEKLPKWTRTTVSADFLRTIKLRLEISGLPQSEWVQMLPLLFGEYDNDKAEWVTKNVVKVTTRWDKASMLFNDHFQERDHTAKIQTDYERCRQGEKETVQSYVERFQHLCTQLGIADTDEQSIHHFTKHLKADNMRAYFMHISNLKSAAKVSGKKQFHRLQLQLKSLQFVMFMCIDPDVSTRTVAALTSAHDNRGAAGGGPSGSGGSLPHGGQAPHNRSTKGTFGGRLKHKRSKSSSSGGDRRSSIPGSGEIKFCKYHPNSTDHTTEECRYGMRLSQAATEKKSSGFGGAPTGSAGGGGAPSSSNAKANVVCYSCGGKGHYSGDPKCPNYKPTPPQQQQQSKKKSIRVLKRKAARSKNQAPTDGDAASDE